jgi:hypothetical protein
MSVCPHGTNRLQLGGFSYNLIFEYFSKICLGNSSFHKNGLRMTGSLHEDQYTFLIISRTVLLRMRHASEKSCSVNHNTHCMFSDVFRKSCRLWDSVEKYCRAGQAADDNMEHALCMLDNYGYRHTLRICNTLLFHYNNGCTNAPHYHVTRTLVVFSRLDKYSLFSCERAEQTCLFFHNFKYQ